MGWTMNLTEHPTVRHFAQRTEASGAAESLDTALDAMWLRRLALEHGADDSGLVEIARPGLDSQRDEILRNYQWTRSLLSLAVRMAREPVRSAPRSVANLEFHRAGQAVDEICADLVGKSE